MTKDRKMTTDRKVTTNSKKGWIRLFFLFLTGSLVGWIYEVTLGFIYGYGFVNRGFLYGPYLPIYGFGLILLYLMLQRLMNKPIKVKNIKINPILVFLGIIVITTCLEFIVGFGMLKIFQIRLWDYSSYWMNYQGIISFNTSIRFGIGGMLLLYALVPLVNKIVNRISLEKLKVIRFIVLAVMIIDTLVTVVNG
ncbi:MAG TPA: putative ABC transporter permease [Clostridia bacterium]|nr:putative ABC transporter permease [Clostridia bacterium]